MDKKLKRQIGYKPSKKSSPQSHETPVAKSQKKEETKIVTEKPVKMGRKPKAPGDIVKIAHVWLTDKEKELIEKKFGSLTGAIRSTALVESIKK